MGGVSVWPYYRLLPSPNPDLPPYSVKTPHMHGAPPSEATPMRDASPPLDPVETRWNYDVDDAGDGDDYDDEADDVD